MKTKVNLAEFAKTALGYKGTVNWARYDALEEIKNDLLGWLLFSEEEEKLTIEIIKKIEKYQKYLLNKLTEKK